MSGVLGAAVVHSLAEDTAPWPGENLCPGEQTEAGWSQEKALCAGELPHIRGAQQQSSLTGKQP